MIQQFLRGNKRRITYIDTSIWSTAGNTDLLVLYNYDSNSIHVETILSRIGYHILLVYQRIYDRLVSRGLRPQLQCIDNETSQDLVHYLEEKNAYFQPAPSYVHRKNAPERAIRTLKNHFIVIMCGTYPNFNLDSWETPVSQALITIGILRKSNRTQSMDGA